MKDLAIRIQELEQQQADQLAGLKQSTTGIAESLTPTNLLKTVFKDISHSPDLRRSVINTAIGIGAGFIGRKIFVGSSNNLFKKITGSAMQFLIANFVRKKMPDITENGPAHQEKEGNGVYNNN